MAKPWKIGLFVANVWSEKIPRIPKILMGKSNTWRLFGTMCGGWADQIVIIPQRKRFLHLSHSANLGQKAPAAIKSFFVNVDLLCNEPHNVRSKKRGCGWKPSGNSLAVGLKRRVTFTLPQKEILVKTWINGTLPLIKGRAFYQGSAFHWGLSLQHVLILQSSIAGTLYPR